MKDKPTCVLCGYPSKDYVVYRVPLTSRPQTRIVCVECIADLRDLAEKWAAGEGATDAGSALGQ